MITRTQYTVTATRDGQADVTIVNDPTIAHDIATFRHEKNGYKPEQIAIDKTTLITITDVTRLGRKPQDIPSREAIERIVELDGRLALARRWREERQTLVDELTRRQQDAERTADAPQT